MINAFALISLVSFIICLTLGIIVYLKKVKYVFDNSLGKMFVLLCLSLALCWASIEFGYRSTDEFSIAYFWLKINVAWYIVISFLMHFTLIFTENSKLLRNKLTYVIIYGPALIFILIDTTTNLLVTEPVKETWGWTYGIPKYPLVHTISSTWAAFAAVFCLYMCLEYYLSQHNTIKKKRAEYVMLGLLIPVGISFNTEWLFPVAGIKSPELFVPATTIYLIIIGYSIWAYGKTDKKKQYAEIKIKVDDLTQKELHNSYF